VSDNEMILAENALKRASGRALFDERVFAHIKLGFSRLTALTAMLRTDTYVVAMHQAFGTSVERVIDKAVQRLRKAGRIGYHGGAGWKVL